MDIKIGAFILCYNEEKYLEKAIQSLLPFVDGIIAVEGAWDYLVRQNFPKRSTDGTIDILKKYESKYPDKMIVVHRNEEECTKQYQVALDILKEKKFSWGFCCDSDEVYPPDTLRVIRRTLEQTMGNVFGYRTHSYNFINSYFEYYNGLYPRLYRVTDHMATVSENRVAWPSHGKQQDSMENPPLPHIKEINPMFRFFHYSYVDIDRFKRRLKYMWATRGSADPELVKKYYLDEQNKIHIPEDLKIFQFKGKHPEIMRDIIQ